MEKWEQNPNWKELPEPEIGDIVHLKLTDAFRYTAKVIVTTVGNNEVTGEIEALFDADTGGWLQGGDKMKFVGQQATFRRGFVQQVIKRNANQRIDP